MIGKVIIKTLSFASCLLFPFKIVVDDKDENYNKDKNKKSYSTMK